MSDYLLLYYHSICFVWPDLPCILKVFQSHYEKDLNFCSKLVIQYMLLPIPGHMLPLLRPRGSLVALRATMGGPLPFTPMRPRLILAQEVGGDPPNTLCQCWEVGVNSHSPLTPHLIAANHCSIILKQKRKKKKVTYALLPNKN